MAAEAADSNKQVNETCEKVVRINAARRLGPWGQRLAATVTGRLPMATQGSLHNVHGLLATLICEEEAEGEVDLSPSMREVIKGLLGQDETVRRFRAVYNRPKKERQELAKQEGRDAYHARDWAQDCKGIVTFKGFTYVPNVGGLRAVVIKTNYDLPWAGHYRVRRTLDLIARKYFWQGMRKDVIQYIKDCAMCAKTKPVRHKPWGTAQSLPTPQAPWTDIALDLIVSLPESQKSNEGKKYNSILVIVDRFSKMAQYIPVRDTIDTTN